MIDKYFAYCPVEGFSTFETEAEAKEYADDSLEHFSDNASEGWDGEVNSICWGEIKQHIVKTLELTTDEATEKGFYIPGCCDGYVDYDLKDVEGEHND